MPCVYPEQSEGPSEGPSRRGRGGLGWGSGTQRTPSPWPSPPRPFGRLRASAGERGQPKPWHIHAIHGVRYNFCFLVAPPGAKNFPHRTLGSKYLRGELGRGIIAVKFFSNSRARQCALDGYPTIERALSCRTLAKGAL